MEQVSINPTFGIEIECMYLLSTNEDQQADQEQNSPDGISSAPFSDSSSDDEPDESDDFDESDESEMGDSDYQAGTHPRWAGIQAIQHALEGPFYTRCSTCHEEHGWTLPLHPLPRNTVKAGYNCWAVTQDATVKLTASEKLHVAPQLHDIDVYSIEIISRVMSSTEALPTSLVQGTGGFHRHSITANDEVAAVYARLHNRFNVYSPLSRQDQRLVINPTCSTHVHVGNSDKGFPLSTVKNLVSIIVACEKVIDSLHATGRVDGGTLAFMPQDGSIHNPEDACIEPQGFNTPVSALFAYKTYCLLKKSNVTTGSYPESRFESFPGLQASASRYDVPSWLNIIRNASGIQDMLDTQGWTSHTSTLNLSNLTQRKTTVEFRQHAGTLHASEILPWIDFCVSLVKFANSRSEDEISQLCAGEWSVPTHNANDLLQTIGVSDDTKTHYAKVVSLPLPRGAGYAAEALQRDLAVAGTWPQNLVLTPLVEHLIRGRCNAINSDVVAERIHYKFIQGCYGKFSADQLSVYQNSDLFPDLTDEERRRLTRDATP